MTHMCQRADMSCKHDGRNDMSYLRLHIATSEMGGDAPTERTRITYQLSQFSDSCVTKKKKRDGISFKCPSVEGGGISLTDPFLEVDLLAMRVGREKFVGSCRGWTQRKRKGERHGLWALEISGSTWANRICPERTGNRWAAEITMSAMRRDRRALIRK